MSAATARSGGSVCFGFGMEFIVTPRTKLHGVFSSSSALWKSESALDLVQPLGTGRNFGCPCRDAREENVLAHVGKIGGEGGFSTNKKGRKFSCGPKLLA